MARKAIGPTGSRRRRWLFLCATGAALVLLMAAGASAHVTGAVNTSDDPGWAGPDQNAATPLGAPTQACLNGPAHLTPAINCNIYAAKTDVFLSGSPNPAALAAGTYFFAVLAPGGQPDPNDSGVKNLSAQFPDLVTNREFSSDGLGGITPLNSSHSYDSVHHVLQLAPFADTPNPGGVYILATCKISDSEDDYQNTVAPVDPHDCKYDAFKVRQTPPGGQAMDLDVTKTATPSFTRDYEWSVLKQQTTSSNPIDTLGSTVNVHYRVQATWSGPIDSGWDVSGTITVTNPNNTDFAGVSVSDQITYFDGTNDVADPNVTCTVGDGGAGGTVDPSNATIPKNDSVDFPYDCSYSAAPADSLETNTASIAWDGTANNTPDSSASFDVPFVWDNADSGNPTVINNCTTVSDLWSKTNTTTAIGSACIDGTFTKAGGNNLSSFTSGYDGPSQTFTFNYTRSVSVVRGTCTEYDNTATVTDGGTGSTDDDTTTNDDSSSASVIVCGPANTGALTIGFWKNTNGQGLIKTYCQSGALGTYLRGLGAGSGPFSNASSTCTGLATYVSGILNGASATNMNVMLKAQMLATALDVWFSGPGWTSTKTGSIKPPSNFLQHNSLGTFNMITTAICPMVDNTTAGTGTCQNNTPSTDAVASGALPTSPMSMQAILDFAATTPSPFNGLTSNSIWYGGNRTLQTVLKNVFDQFNNGDAFGSF
jgi:hypothetical protein